MVCSNLIALLHNSVMQVGKYTCKLVMLFSWGGVVMLCLSLESHWKISDFSSWWWQSATSQWLFSVNLSWISLCALVCRYYVSFGNRVLL